MILRVLNCQWQAKFYVARFINMAQGLLEERKRAEAKELMRISRAQRIQKKLRAYFAVIGNSASDRVRLNGA